MSREEQMASLQQQSNEKLIKAEADREAAQREAFLAHEQLAELQDSANATSASDQQLRDEHAKQVRSLQAEVASLKQQQKSADDQKSRIKILEAELASLKQQLLDQQQQAEADALQIASTAQSTEADIADLQLQLETKAAEASTFQSQLAAAESNIASLRAQHVQDMASAEEKTASAQKALLEAEKLIGTLKARQLVANGSQSQPLTPPATPPARMTHSNGHAGQAAGRPSATAHASTNITIGSQPYAGGYPSNASPAVGQPQPFHGFQQWQNNRAGSERPQSRQALLRPNHNSASLDAHVGDQDASPAQPWSNEQHSQLQDDAAADQIARQQGHDAMQTQRLSLDDTSRPSTSGIQHDLDNGGLPHQGSISSEMRTASGLHAGFNCNQCPTEEDPGEPLCCML